MELSPICRLGISVVTLLRSVICWRSSERDAQRGHRQRAALQGLVAFLRGDDDFLDSTSADARLVAARGPAFAPRGLARRQRCLPRRPALARSRTMLMVRSLTTSNVRPVPASMRPSASVDAHASRDRRRADTLRRRRKSNSTCSRDCVAELGQRAGRVLRGDLEAGVASCARAASAGSAEQQHEHQARAQHRLRAGLHPIELEPRSAQSAAASPAHGGRRTMDVWVGGVDLQIEGAGERGRETLRIRGVELPPTRSCASVASASVRSAGGCSD